MINTLIGLGIMSIVWITGVTGNGADMLLGLGIFIIFTSLLGD